MAQNETLVPTAHTTPISMNVNVLPRDIYEELSAQERIAPQELWFVTSADSVVVELDKYVTSAWVADYVQQAIAQAMS